MSAAELQEIGLVPELHKFQNKSCISLREMRFYKEVVPKLKFRNNSIVDARADKWLALSPAAKYTCCTADVRTGRLI